MLKRLSNRGEIYVHDLLAPSAARHDAHVYRKIRIADVVEIDALGDRELGRFALMGHFDFVLADKHHQPQAAIEYDGGGHDPRNDALKDEICRRAGLALFRLTQNSAYSNVDEATFVAYLVDVWFLAKEFERQQHAGLIPHDEPFMMAAFLKPDAQNVFDSEFDYVLAARSRLNKVVRDPMAHLEAASLVLVGPAGEYAAFARYGDHFGAIRLAFRVVSWGELEMVSAARELGEFVHAMAYRDLCAVIADPARHATWTAEDVAREIKTLRASGFRLTLGINRAVPDALLR